MAAKSDKPKMSRGGAAGEFPPEVGGNKPVPGIGERVPEGGAKTDYAGDRPKTAVKGDTPPGSAGSGGPHGSEKESLAEDPSNAALGGGPGKDSI
jgi:hypothetical protein